MPKKPISVSLIDRFTRAQRRKTRMLPKAQKLPALKNSYSDAITSRALKFMGIEDRATIRRAQQAMRKMDLKIGSAEATDIIHIAFKKADPELEKILGKETSTFHDLFTSACGSFATRGSYREFGIKRNDFTLSRAEASDILKAICKKYRLKSPADIFTSSTPAAAAAEQSVLRAAARAGLRSIGLSPEKKEHVLLSNLLFEIIKQGFPEYRKGVFEADPNYRKNTIATFSKIVSSLGGRLDLTEELMRNTAMAALAMGTVARNISAKRNQKIDPNRN